MGLGYLTLNRLSSTLSGGESQRISLATSLGSALVGSMYILDEPSIGLHPKDAEQLIGVLRSLQQLGNTVIVVEHEEKMMEPPTRLSTSAPKPVQRRRQPHVPGHLSRECSETPAPTPAST